MYFIIPEPQGMKKPCGKCTVFRAYYENPCWTCIHNPKSPEEILENYRIELFKKRFDRYKNDKFEGKVAETVLVSQNGKLETYECGACHKEFMTITGNNNRAFYCPECGSKINYAE